MNEHPFQAELLLALTQVPGVRVHRQNVGSVPVRGARRWFHAGPPEGAADISGIVGPEGWRLEIECKAAGRKRKPAQIQWAEQMAGLGAIYLLADARRGVEAVVADVCRLIDERRAAARLDTRMGCVERAIVPRRASS